MNEIFVYVAPVQWKPRWEIKIHRCGNIFSRSKKEIARHSLSPREKFQRVIFQREIVSSNHQKRKKKRTFEKKIQDTRNFVTINCEGFLEKIMDSDKIYQKAIKFSEMYINILYWFYTNELFNFVEINLFESWMKNCSKSNLEQRPHMFNLFHQKSIRDNLLFFNCHSTSES